MNNLISVHIADLHFGKINPYDEYKILQEQFLYPISQLPRIDLIAINGDIFDHKLMANSDSIRYAVQFVDNVVQISKEKNATVIITAGTLSHESSQTKLFYHYMEDKSIDVRIVETIRFEIVKGFRVLCIPELYGVDEDVYQHFFIHSGWYDLALIHGTFEGSVYGNNVGQGRLLKKEDFILCKGFCTSGHVHTPGCFAGFYHYCGTPIKMSFSDEDGDRGFLISNQDKDTGVFYVQFYPIHSFIYRTVYYEDIVQDPKTVIDYINNLKQIEGIDYIRVRFKQDVSGANRTIINNYFRNNNSTTIEFNDSIEMKNEAQMKESISNNENYSYLTDDKLSDYERFVMFINQNEGEGFITVDQLTNLLSKEI